MSEEDEEEISCAEQYEHGCDNCEEFYGCPYRDCQWTDPTDEKKKETKHK